MQRRYLGPLTGSAELVTIRGLKIGAGPRSQPRQVFFRTMRIAGIVNG